MFLLDSASEILFVGDAGDTEASRPSRRVGIEWTNDYRPLSWLSLEADLAMTRARFRGDDPDQAAALCVARRISGVADRQRARAIYIPGAPNMIASAGIRLGEGDRLVRRAALSLFRAAAADRGQCLRLAGDRVC